MNLDQLKNMVKFSILINVETNFSSLAGSVLTADKIPLNGTCQCKSDALIHRNSCKNLESLSFCKL